MTENVAHQETEKSISQRLQETAAVCLANVEQWEKNLKCDETREKLLEAVHELRKVCARLEVDIAMNDRSNTNAKHIPIPEHKSKMEKRKNQKPLSEILPVAEIKKANERKKIEIQDAEDDDIADNEIIEDTTETSIEETETKVEDKPKRRPRRKKKEETDNE